MPAENVKPMQRALMLAHQAAACGEVPVGAVVVDDTGNIWGASHNHTEGLKGITAHAEMLAIREACQKRSEKHLEDYDLYVTLEPCAMCAQAVSYARIRRLYFGAYDPKSGGVEHGAKLFSQPTCHHRPEVYGGIEEEACKLLLKQFFAERR